jgi:hypothetical protein
MSVSLLASAGRIDTEASRLVRQASQLNSQLSALVNEVNAFAAFMHTDPRAEFSQADRDKYSDDFMAQLTAIQTNLQGLNALGAVETNQMTVADFLAQYVGNVTEYSSRFDRG